MIGRVLLAHFGSETPQPVSAPDQVLVSGLLANGAPLSIHYRGGTARDGDGLFWEINGTEGDIRVSAPSRGHTQLVPLSLKGARGDEKAFRPLQVPASYRPAGRRTSCRVTGSHLCEDEPGPAGWHPYGAQLRGCGRGASPYRGDREISRKREPHCARRSIP
jgi:hypothetical protein